MRRSFLLNTPAAAFSASAPAMSLRIVVAVLAQVVSGWQLSPLT